MRCLRSRFTLLMMLERCFRMSVFNGARHFYALLALGQRVGVGLGFLLVGEVLQFSFFRGNLQNRSLCFRRDGAVVLARERPRIEFLVRLLAFFYVGAAGAGPRPRRPSSRPCQNSSRN